MGIAFGLPMGPLLMRPYRRLGSLQKLHRKETDITKVDLETENRVQLLAKWVRLGNAGRVLEWFRKPATSLTNVAQTK